MADGGSNAIKTGKRLGVAVVLGALGAWHTLLGPHAERTQQAALHPEGVALSEITDNVYVSFLFVGVCGLLDVLVARWFGAARYFALHVTVNLITIAFSWQDALFTLLAANPYETNSCSFAGTPCASKVGLDLTVGIHLWHALAYALKPIDWIHHLPTYVVCAIGLYVPFGPGLNFALLALMGVPGGIDYLLLVLVKLGLLNPLVEKSANQSLNVWLRCPIAVISAYVYIVGAGTWRRRSDPGQARALARLCPALPCSARAVTPRAPAHAVIHPEHFTGDVHRALHAFMGLHHYWNGCFFMYRTVEARTRYVHRAKRA